MTLGAVPYDRNIEAGIANIKHGQPKADVVFKTGL